jgi:hypothetical protein
MFASNLKHIVFPEAAVRPTLQAGGSIREFIRELDGAITC